MSLTFGCWQQLFSGEEKLHASTERTEISVVKNLISMLNLWQQFCSKTAHLLPCSTAVALCDPLASCFLFFTQLMQNPLCSDFSLLQCLSHDSENRRGWHVCFMRIFFTWFASIFFQQGAVDNHRYHPLLLLAAHFLGHLGCLPDLHGNEMPTVTPCYNPLHYSRKLHVKHYEFRLGFFPHKVSILMYDDWSLHEIWPQSVSSSISRLRFAEHWSRSLPIRTQCSLLKSGSHLLWKSERFHHPTGHASTVCRTFEMTYVVDCCLHMLMINTRLFLFTYLGTVITCSFLLPYLPYFNTV